MIEPLLSDNALLASIESGAQSDAQFRLWWLGQSGFLIQWNGFHALLDPYLSDSLTKKYATTNKPHTRMTRRVIAPERLAFVDLVTASHVHTDHLDPETLTPLFDAALNAKRRAPAVLVAPESIRDEAAKRSGLAAESIIGMDVGTRAQVGPFEIIGIPAAHNRLDKNGQGLHLYLGYVLKFGSWALYHSGDTLLYPELPGLLREHKIDIAFLPINGNKPERGVAGNLDGAEAALLARDAGIGLVIPCHYDMFTFNTESPDLFVRECERLGQQYRVLRCGEYFTWGDSKHA